MEELNATTVYWLISIGLMTGYTMKMILRSRGMGLTGNLVTGVAGTLTLGLFAIAMNLFGALIYAAIGTGTILFLVNVFNIEPDHSQKSGIAR